MFLSVLLRGTLLLLLADHSLSQESYTQEEFGPQYYTSNVVQDPQSSFLEKRDAENTANNTNAVHLEADYFGSNVRQKRDVDTDDEEHDHDVTGNGSSEDHVNDVSDGSYHSSDENTPSETNMTSAETNHTYDAGGWYSGDIGNKTMNSDLIVNETSSSLLDDAEQSGDIMDDREEESETKPFTNKTMQESSEKYRSEEGDSHVSHMTSVVEENKKKANVTEDQEIEETSEETEASGNFPKLQHFLSDEEEDEEQPVKRQNLGMKNMRLF